MTELERACAAVPSLHQLAVVSDDGLEIWSWHRRPVTRKEAIAVAYATFIKQARSLARGVGAGELSMVTLESERGRVVLVPTRGGLRVALLFSESWPLALVRAQVRLLLSMVERTLDP